MNSWTGELRIRHNDPSLVDRVDRALEDNTLPNQFIPEPTTFEGASWGIESGQERLRYDWRQANWGCWAMSTRSTKRIDPCTVRALFEFASNVPVALLQRMVELGYSIEGNCIDDTCMFAVRCDNAVITEDRYGETVPNWNAYVDACESRGARQFSLQSASPITRQWSLTSKCWMPKRTAELS